MAYGGGEDIKKNYDFVDDFNELEIRITKRCICKVCDKQLENEKIIYIKSFRLHAQPFHICISCWKQINKLVEENELEEAVYGDSTKKKLEKWVKDNYKQYSTEWTYERSAGNDSDCFEDGYESGTSWAAYKVGCILGMKLKDPDWPEY